MKTPIVDFVREYAAGDPVRVHMPGHKGVPFLGCESPDITELDGADNLYAPEGIIAESEANAGALFGCRTFYSAEGSSLGIRAMLRLMMQLTGSRTVLAPRNVHKTFLYAAALLDLDVRWLHPQTAAAYYSCAVTAQDVENALRTEQPSAVYLTSPDYLGNMPDVAAIARVCRAHGVLLLVDNAHGAYLHFLPQPLHPMDLGADMCCDSAHKTLPVLTGGAYLHLSEHLPIAHAQVKEALALFGSTSPSYLILQSLDLANHYLETYRERLAAFLPQVDALRQSLTKQGFTLCGSDPLRITIRARSYGYTGDALAEALLSSGIFCEMHDPDYLVCMLTPENTPDDLRRVREAFAAIARRDPLPENAPVFHAPQNAMRVRDAMFAPQETVRTDACIGRVMASAAVSCPPAVPIVLCGERIDEEAVARLRYYGVHACAVVIE